MAAAAAAAGAGADAKRPNGSGSKRTPDSGAGRPNKTAKKDECNDVAAACKRMTAFEKLCRQVEDQLCDDENDDKPDTPDGVRALIQALPARPLRDHWSSTTEALTQQLVVPRMTPEQYDYAIRALCKISTDRARIESEAHLDGVFQRALELSYYLRLLVASGVDLNGSELEWARDTPITSCMGHAHVVLAIAMAGRRLRIEWRASVTGDGTWKTAAMKAILLVFNDYLCGPLRLWSRDFLAARLVHVIGEDGMRYTSDVSSHSALGEVCGSVDCARVFRSFARDAFHPFVDLTFAQPITLATTDFFVRLNDDRLKQREAYTDELPNRFTILVPFVENSERVAKDIWAIVVACLLPLS